MNLSELDSGKKLKIGVIGDIMLDVYEDGRVNRISPEFPVVILKSDNSNPNYVPGGAANVAAQFKFLNSDTTLYGFADKECLEKISNFGFAVNRIIEIEEKVPRKIRFYDQDFPLLRWDQENINFSDIINTRKKILNNLSEDVNNLDVVIISNYAKGLFDRQTAKDIIKICNNIPTIVDPKNNFDWWQGCTILKPNLEEANKFTSINKYISEINEPVLQAQYILMKSYAQSVIITMGGKGIVGVDKENSFYYKPKQNNEVNSVIGAGDCYAAYLTYLIGKGIDLKNSAEIAFQAGAEYVKNKHNHPVSWHEVLKRIDPYSSKIVNLPQAKQIIKEIYKKDKWVFTNGCFDLFHKGHRDSLIAAKKLGDKLIVAVNSDQSVKLLKGQSRPICCLSDRLNILSSLEMVDLIIPFEEVSPFNLIRELQPDVVAKGNQYIGSPVVPDDYKGIVSYLPMTDGFSTTSLIEKIKKL